MNRKRAVGPSTKPADVDKFSRSVQPNPASNCQMPLLEPALVTMIPDPWVESGSITPRSMIWLTGVPLGLRSSSWTSSIKLVVAWGESLTDSTRTRTTVVPRKLPLVKAISIRRSKVSGDSPRASNRMHSTSDSIADWVANEVKLITTEVSDTRVIDPI